MANTEIRDFSRAEIEDFRNQNAADLKSGNSPFLKYIDSTYKQAVRLSVEPVAAEIKQHRDAFTGANVQDYYEMSFEDDFKKDTFYPYMIFQYCRDLAASLTAQRPDFNFDPEFVEDLEEKFNPLRMNLSKQEIRDLEEFKGISLKDPDNPTAGYDMNWDGVREWFNDIIDNDWKWFWEENRLSTILYGWIMNCCIAGKSSIGVRRIISGGKPKLIFENSMPENVAYDMAATSRQTERYKFITYKRSPAEIERMFGLQRESIVYERDYSEYSEESEIPALPRTRIVVGYFRDETTIKITNPETGVAEEIPVYPDGRKITFVLGQKEGLGVKVLEDDAYEYAEWPDVDLILIPLPGRDNGGLPFCRLIANLAVLATQVLQQVIANLKTAGNTAVATDGDEPAQRVKLDGNTEAIPGSILSPNMQTSKILQAQPMVQPGIMLYEFIMKIAREVTGITPAAVGMLTQSQQSGKALDNLRDASNAAWRNTGWFFEEGLLQAAKVYACFRLPMMTAGMSYRTGENFKDRRKISFNMQDFVVSIRPNLVAGSSNPRNDAQDLVIISELIKSPVPIPLPLLDMLFTKLALPDKTKLLAKFDEAYAMMQQLQQLQSEVEQDKQVIQELEGKVSSLWEENLGLNIDKQISAQGMEIEMAKLMGGQQRIETSVAGKIKEKAIDAATKLAIAKQKPEKSKTN